MSKKIRVRFAPSPTGPLHIGGVRTALYNYLFAKKNGGDFILRIEDTDQTRFVKGAEEYIIESLKWCGIIPNEGIGFGNGEHSPYRQSERKEKGVYRQYAEELVKNGFAYYAFDTTEELEEMRKRIEAAGGTSSYNAITRQNMKNSLSLPEDETKRRLDAKEEYVIRIKIPRNEEIRLNDTIRGWVVVNTSQLDDKVLFKSDGMPTYHLANVVDDYLMKITHVIRGEEWLPSAPLHVLLYKYLGWELHMPTFAHLPLLLRPDGNGKLSKRDGDRLGFPVFPLEWTDPASGEKSSGYREKGYYTEAVVNMLALLGWHTSGNRELFTLDEMVQEFSLERVSKSGAKFDPEKAKWFNQHYLRLRNDAELAEELKAQAKNHPELTNANKLDDHNFLIGLIKLLKEKVFFAHEFIEQGKCFILAPDSYEEELVSKKWNDASARFLSELHEGLNGLNEYSHQSVEETFKKLLTKNGLKTGDVMQLVRISLIGTGTGPALFDMCVLLGKQEVATRMERFINLHKK